MTPQRLRAYVLIVIRDVLIPLGGVFLAIYLPTSGKFEPWQLPLLAGMMGVPLVARGGTDAEEDERPLPPAAPPPVLAPPPDSAPGPEG